ncbi:RrF2 family transcriptional regulator [Amphritea balenae]|uniref:Rrf2 family transcriptional regulator n=1 Tax=Amphritea balenae TaxID=452629 RepID=A0A3P1SN31_9GAMM|nr:Rrf2 family transcriptional regulator [Amphritea balenae]RRC98065.1 Rrf2 family transcriptional regulator [Amphritea balenae]GGK67280.1 Rrf2 family transcriptional regulator [Amphritea balenae]
MQISRFSDYTLRTLFYVATHSDQLSTLAEISNYYDISIEHLRKVVHALSKSGYLQTFRGKNGGIRLALPPEEINIGQLIQQSEGNSPLIDCTSQDCRIRNVCSFQGILAEAQQAFISTLSKYSLADLLESPSLRSTLIAVE